jgi:hypothetical protein
VIPQVVASERGTAQTGVQCCSGVVGPQYGIDKDESKDLERSATEGESPVGEVRVGLVES